MDAKGYRMETRQHDERRASNLAVRLTSRQDEGAETAERQKASTVPPAVELCLCAWCCVGFEGALASHDEQ